MRLVFCKWNSPLSSGMLAKMCKRKSLTRQTLIEKKKGFSNNENLNVFSKFYLCGYIKDFIEYVYTVLRYKCLVVQ